MRSKLDSADLTQSAYGDALRALPSFEAAGPGSFRRWLLGILRNKVRHRVRFFLSRRRDIGQEANERELQSLPSAATSPLAIAVLDEDKRRLRSAVEHLPPRQRAVVEARYFEELPWRDIALQLGTSEEAAQMLLARALAALRGALGSAAPSRSSR
jgi:RNA polymerase sigma factor (sigma-70 family)